MSAQTNKYGLFLQNTVICFISEAVIHHYKNLQTQPGEINNADTGKKRMSVKPYNEFFTKNFAQKLCAEFAKVLDHILPL